MKAFLSLSKILIATFAGLSFASLLVALPSIANTTLGTDSNSNDSNTNPLSNTSDFSILDLVHRAKFGTVELDPQLQNQQLNDTFATFKAKQQKLMGNGQQKPVTQPPAVENKPVQTILPLNK
jgi:hypothetical protein